MRFVYFLIFTNFRAAKLRWSKKRLVVGTNEEGNERTRSGLDQYNTPSTSQSCVSSSKDERHFKTLAPHVHDDNYANQEQPALQTENENIADLTGRRIVDVCYFFKQLQEISNHGPFGCTLLNLEIISELRNGLQSTFKFKCKMCNAIKEISTDSNGSEFNINSAAVLGILSIGCGFSQMEELLATINMPCMSYRKFSSEHDKIGHILHKTAAQQMEQAGKEEAKIARELGFIDKDGFPLITVIADGAWCKRSYKVKYDASSGVGCIIGEATGKLLFLGVRNRYCSTCAFSERQGRIPPEHLCFKNWSASSTAMEADIIVEGFKRSKEMHGIIYNKLVGDGDSSVTKRLREARPYGSLVVEKVECSNHLLRNYCNKLRELSKSSRCGSKLVPPYLRKKLEHNILRLRVAIKKAAEKRREEDATLTEKIVQLSKDILNSPSHVFGQHEKCVEIGYFCDGAKPEEENLVPKMMECGLYPEIMKYLHRIVQHCSSLLLNMTNNAAEQYNSIVCKFTGGKRIDFSKGSSFQFRCEAAAISFNAKENYLDRIYKTATTVSPKTHTKKYIRTKSLKRLREARQRLNSRRRYKMKTMGPDKEYGNVDEEEICDIPHEEYEAKKEEFLRGLRKSKEEIKNIERLTRGQNANPLWKQERSYRITASNFGAVCKMRKSTSCANMVKKLLYNEFSGSIATKYGVENEPFAKAAFERMTGQSVEDCGLFIGEDQEYFLGASPDGIVKNTNAIVEIKCPYKIQNMSPREAIEKKALDFLEIHTSTDQINLKRTHNYMYQIQGQLHICNKSICYFVVWSPLGIHIEEIERDDVFWETKMRDHLHKFFMVCLLPEILDPRYPRNAIRNPDRN